MPTTQRFVCDTGECAGFDNQAITTSYDQLGRVTTYEDADGNKAQNTYDSFGRPSTFSDGKGTQTVQYDSTTGLINGLTDSAAGTFTATYDADHNLVKRGLPNGLTAETTYDSTGAAVSLTYTKASNCGTSCTWLQFNQQESIYGQIMAQSSTLAGNQYVYDRAGRLTEARVTPTGGACTTRNYGYDKNSNRLSLTTTPATLGGGCASGLPSEKKYAYDKADRLVDTGVVYDNFGRMTKLPGADAGGKDLTTSYYSTGMVATQSQGSITNSFELDSSLRQRSRLQGGGGLEGIEVFHYAGPADSPAWTQRGSTWSRNIVGIGGELAAIQESGKEATLPLANLHGDVVAMAALDPTVSAIKATYSYDEFGNPTSGTAGRFGWLGSSQRRTEFSSGVLQMGARSYAPAAGRFLSPDSVLGGSANPYDYGNADPLNQIDLSGLKPTDRECFNGPFGNCVCELLIKMWSHERGRMGMHWHRRCDRDGGIRLTGWALAYYVNLGGFLRLDEAPHFVRPLPSIKPVCGRSERCQNDMEFTGVFVCVPEVEYQIKITWGWVFNSGSDRGLEHQLDVKAQEYCAKK